MAGETERPEVIARGDGVLGEVALRRRGGAANAVGDSGRVSGRCPRGDVFELIVNGVFLMDTAETSTEERLAQAVLDRHPAPRRIMVGGLGLGFTTAALLHDPRVERVDVVEIEPLLVDWLRDGLVPAATTVLEDPRVRVQVSDIRDALAGADPVYDAILLDVDNGPDFLVHQHNAPVYQQASLEQAAAALAPSGVLAVWSSSRSLELLDGIAATCGHSDEIAIDITREGRVITYYLYTGSHPPVSKPSTMVTRGVVLIT